MHDTVIRPIQLCDRSNKFRCAPSTAGEGERYAEPPCTVATPPPSVVALTMVCKQIYMEVAGTHIFYKINRFYIQYHCEFPFSITPARFHAIRSITCDWNPCCNERIFKAFAICKGLESLELHYDFNEDGLQHHVNPHTLATPEPYGLPALKLLVRGLKNVAVYPPRMGSYMGTVAQQQSKHNIAIPFCLDLERQLQKHMKEPRVITNAMVRVFKQLQMDAYLDIHGEGRLGDYLRPEIVSSRTRSQLRSSAMINPDGTLPQMPRPKYNAEGQLTRYVSHISDSRETAVHDGLSGVEFRVYHRANMDDDSMCVASWEDADVLSSPESLESIIDYYNINEMAAGKEALVEYWNLQCNDVIGKWAKANFTMRIRGIIEYERRVRVATEKSIKAAKAGKAKRKR